jgi:hypothetical protein
LEKGDGRRRGLKWLDRFVGVTGCGSFRQQKVLGVDKAMARLPEALRRLVLSKAVYRHALLADAGCEASEVAVGGDKAEPVEPPGVQEVHGVDHQRDVGRILPVVYANCCCGMMAC